MPDDLDFARFAIYAYDTGDIRAIVICQYGAIDSWLMEGERRIECPDPAITDETHKVIAAEFVPR